MSNVPLVDRSNFILCISEVHSGSQHEAGVIYDEVVKCGILRPMPTRDEIAKVLCLGTERNGGLPWEGLNKHNRSHFVDQADAILALIQGDKP